MKNLNKTLYIRNQDGQFVGAISVLKLWVMITFVLAILIGGVYFTFKARSIAQGQEVPVEQEKATVNVTELCTKTREGYTDCTDIQTRLRIYELTEGGKKPIKWYTPKEFTLLKVCEDHGLGEECAATLYGMAKQESLLGVEMVGDNGRSHGWFHIMDYNKVPKDCAYSLECSANWSLERMLKYGYMTNADRAIMKHNGTPGTKATLGYLARVKKYAGEYQEK